MRKLSVSFILQCLIFLVPVNFYIIGDWMGIGIQWVLFRYQQSYIGVSVLSTINDLYYIETGLIHGRSAIAIIIWIIAALIFIGCFTLNLATIRQHSKDCLKNTSIATILSGFLLILSDMIQYGPLFHGTAGTCIPIGIPLIIFLGWWAFRIAENTEEESEPENQLCWDEKIPLLNITIRQVRKSVWVNDLSILIFVSVFMKIIVLSLSFYTDFEAIHADTDLYYHYVTLFFSGTIPYTGFTVEYPQFFFIPAAIAYIPVIFLQNSWVYFFSFMGLMYIADAATVICVYLIAVRLFNRDRAFLCGMLYVTAISTAFFIPITYDIVPTLFLMISFVLYLYHRPVSGYLMATAGALTKWFPVFALPCFIIHSIKKRDNVTDQVKGITFSSILVLIVIIPFMLINSSGVLQTYFFHFNRITEEHSLVYYGDSLINLFLNNQPIDKISLILIVVFECILFFWYYRSLKNDFLTLYYILFLSIFIFFLFNKVFSACYLIWLTPFLALLLTNSIRQIILFYLVQVVVYIETPLLYGIVYGRNTRYEVMNNTLPSLSFVFYTIKFAIFFIVLYIIIHDIRTLQHSEKKLVLSTYR